MRRLLTAMIVVGGCRVAEIDLTGKACPCPSGWRCDENTNTCTRSDAGSLDDDAPDGSLAAFGVPMPLPGPVNTSSDEKYPSLDATGTQLIFGTPRVGGYTLWFAVRTRTQDAFGTPLRIVELDGTGIEYFPEISGNALELIYNGNMPEELRQVTRSASNSAWGMPSPIATPDFRIGASLSPDGAHLYLAIPLDGGIEEYTRTMTNEWTLARTHPALAGMTTPTVSTDGLEMFMASETNQLYRATRDEPTASFGSPQRVLFGTAIDNAMITDPELDSTGRALYLAVRTGADFDLYVATR